MTVMENDITAERTTVKQHTSSYDDATVVKEEIMVEESVHDQHTEKVI